MFCSHLNVSLNFQEKKVESNAIKGSNSKPFFCKTLVLVEKKQTNKQTNRQTNKTNKKHFFQSILLQVMKYLKMKPVFNIKGQARVNVQVITPKCYRAPTRGTQCIGRNIRLCLFYQIITRNKITTLTLN